MSPKATANRVLFINTLAFAASFAVWTMFGVLVTYLADNKIVPLDKAQIGWLLGAPVLTGSIMRLPVGMLADRYGGRPVYLTVMLLSAAGAFLTSYASTFMGLLRGGLAFGLAGATFAVGVAYTSAFFPQEKQGTALGIFGMGNIGAAATSAFAPQLLLRFVDKGANPEGWRMLPKAYAGLMVVTAIVFLLLSAKEPQKKPMRSLADRMAPLKDLRVWRFGLHYFLLFGGFVGLSQWLIPYYVNVYGMTLASAGLMAALFSFPSPLTRAAGGWISDRIGARTTLYWVFGICVVFFMLLVMPRMDITSPGEGVMAPKAGVVTSVELGSVTVDGVNVPYKSGSPGDHSMRDGQTLVWPTFDSWQEPVVKVGQRVQKKELLARGVTHIYFQANSTVFTVLLLIAGMSMGVGMAAVYKHITHYYPKDVGSVGGLVGVIGGLGGFVAPILFGMMLKSTGVWTTCWLLLAAVAVICLVWMHVVILKLTRKAEELHETGDLEKILQSESAKEPASV